MTETDTTDRKKAPTEHAELPTVTCESWGEDSLYPLHEEWASGEIAERDYRILRSLQGPHILVEFDDMDTPVAFELGDLLQHDHASTSKEEIEA